MSKDLKKSSPRIDSIILQLSATTKQLSQLDMKETVDKINKTVLELSTLLAKVNAGEGSLGKLTKDEALYNNINTTVKQLDILLKDIEKYPRRYTGITEKQRKKGDKDKATSGKN